VNIGFDTTIKLSDLLTSLSFILAVVAFLYTHQKDRTTADREQISEARVILTNGLSGLERWGNLAESVFDEAQPNIIVTTEIWAKDGNVIMARDHLWRELNTIFQDVERKILDEKLSSAYIALYRISKDLPMEYRDVLTKLRQLSDETRRATLLDTQRAVLGFDQQKGERVTAQMGDQLREAIESNRMKYHDKFTEITASISARILNGVAKDDQDLLVSIRLQSL